MSETQKAETKADEKAQPQPIIHRVCIACNNMFTVTLDHYDAKHCPNCHKG